MDEEELYDAIEMVDWGEVQICDLRSRNEAARAIMEKFVNKVETGRARSKETYAEMKEWLKEEDNGEE